MLLLSWSKQFYGLGRFSYCLKNINPLSLNNSGIWYFYKYKPLLATSQYTMTLKLCGMPWRPNLEKLGEPWLTSKWSTWWKFNSLIWWIYYLRSKNSRTVTPGSCRMARANFPKTWPHSCLVPVYLIHMNQPPGNIMILSQQLLITNYHIQLYSASTSTRTPIRV